MSLKDRYSKLRAKRLLIMHAVALVVILFVFMLNWKTVMAAIMTRAFNILHGNALEMAETETVIAWIGIIAALLLLFRIIYYKTPVNKWMVPIWESLGTIHGTLMRMMPERRFRLFGISLVLILLYFAPYLIKGQDSYVKIFDVLDAWVPQTKVLANSGLVFSLSPSAVVPNYAGGLHLSGFNNGYNISTLFFALFPPFMAYMLNQLVMCLTAFWGMVLLLRRYVVGTIGFDTESPETANGYSWLVVGVSLCFSLLTFYPPAGLSVSGLPLLLYFFLKIRNGQGSKRDLIFIFLFPFYSLLHHAGLFILILLAAFFLFDWIKTRRFNGLYFIGLAGMSLLYGFTHFHMIYSFVAAPFVSARQEIEIIPMDAAACFKESIHNFVFDRTNIVSAQRLVVMFSAAWALVLGLFRLKTDITGDVKSKTNINHLYRLVIFIALAFVNSLLWGFKYWHGMMVLRDVSHFFTAFNFARFYWLNPVVWYIVFALALVVLAKRLKRGPVVVSVLIGLQILFMFSGYNLEYRHRYGRVTNAHSTLTYRQFYSEKLYKEIADYIGKPQNTYNTVSIGLHPAVANYNGFHTLDLYTNIYPLEYKHRFRRIMEKELAKNEQLAYQFDKNGKRCYLFVNDLHGRKNVIGTVFARGITRQESRNLSIDHLDFNTPAFKEMGGQYILSAVQIKNDAANGLVFEKRFQSEDSPWRIYLYRVL